MSDHENGCFDELLARVLEVPADEQRAFIEDNCDDPELCKKLIETLDDEAELSQFLERPAVLVLGSDRQKPAQADSPSRSFGVPKTIGPFRIRELLGEGGMGVVYLAEQDQPVHRLLAVKVVRTDLSIPGAYERFSAERQALARLSHPAIAQMYEAGTTDNGYPYFAMELVTGEPITDYCDRKRMALEERLELFRQVCLGVQHAHQRGIIHRDLKPSNIMVTEVDGVSTAKIIDFGIAKALDQPLDEGLTGTGIVGTPEYMSPEALGIADGASEVDTRSDVYALGILLFDLLSGTRPYRRKRGGAASIAVEIASGDSRPPSVTLQSQPADFQDLAAQMRQCTREGLIRRLRGDLDWIVDKAIARHRDDRYDSPAALVADIHRHLTNQPVFAGPPSAFYVFGKLVRRHRGAVAAATAILALLVLGIAGTSIGFVRAQREAARASDEAKRATEESQRANQEAATAAAVSEFMINLFSASDPAESRGASVSARDLLDRGAERITEELEDQPLVQARLRASMARIYSELGLLDQAMPLVDAVLETSEGDLVSDDVTLADSLTDLITPLKLAADLDRAERCARQALELRRRGLGPRHRKVATSVNHLATVIQDRGNDEGALGLYQEALEIVREQDEVDELAAAEFSCNLAYTFENLGNGDAAEPLYRNALEVHLRLVGDDHPKTLTLMNNLAHLLYQKKDFVQAGEMARNALEGKRRVLGPDHPEVALSFNTLGMVLTAQGDLAEAEACYRETVRILRQALGPDHPNVAMIMVNISALASSQGRAEEALEIVLEAIELLRVHYPEGSTALYRAIGRAGWLKAEAGRHREAVVLRREELAMRRKILGDQHPSVANSMTAVALLDEALGRTAEAEAGAGEALELYRTIYPDGHQMVARGERVLGAMASADRRFEEAERLLVSSLASYAKLDPEGDGERATLEALIELYESWGRDDDAGVYRDRLTSRSAAEDQSGQSGT